MKTERTQAIILRRTNYGEADRILQLLTPNGRRAVMARGVRKEKSKLAGGIELFAVSDVVLGEGKGELGILTSARLVQFYRHILEDYDRLQFGYQAMALVARASETVDEPEWFDLLVEVLAALDVKTVPLSLVKAWFYLHYSALLGYELNVSRDVQGDPLQSDVPYLYDVAEKGLRIHEQGNLSSDHVKLLRLLASRSLKVLVQIGGIAELIDMCAQVAEQHAAVEVRASI